jgi:3-hydroxyacyl-CoA dehydrogenase/enoyl-CoA hydratase/3-hydroxybutyryl-CoA epimerase
MTNALTLTVEKNGVANLVFNLPNEKVNKLSAPVMSELEKALNVIDGNKGIRVLIITSEKKDIFIAGADINEIKDIYDEKTAYEKVSRGQNILNKIASLKIPTVAVINGACLGGGLELALACTYRVAILNPKTSLGLPEVNLGIIPGFGGTQRLPKLLGLQESLKIILSGKAIDANKAFKIGLIDDIIREEFMEEKLGHFLTEVIKSGDDNHYLAKRKAACKKRFYFETLLLGKFLIFYMAKKDLYEKTKGHYPAPFYALEVIRRTYGMTYGNRGFKTELDAFCELVVGNISKNLIDIFFINEELKKDDGVNNESLQNIKDIRNSALLGAGIMGGGIAWLFANNNINIRIKDITQNAIALGYNQVLKIFNQLKKIRKLTTEQVNMKMAKISAGLDYSGFNNADLIIEAVVENIEVKKKILAETEKYVKKDAIIASNTSSLSISKMAGALENPERFAGMHFFNPVNRMPLVEVIRGEKTSDETIATIVKISKKIGKTPIVVKDVPGFLVNRILLPFMNEAAYLLQDGAEIAKIDEIVENFGMPMGPFVLADVVGIDVGVKVAHSLYEGYGNRMAVAPILDEIHNKHKDLLGKKSKKGFYLYGFSEKQNKLNPEIDFILQDVRKNHQIQPSYISNQEIINRTILTMVNEAAKCLEESVVKSARHLDMAMIMGAGFPAFRGGVLKYADFLGIKEVVAKLQDLNKKYGLRFTPSKLLLDMAKNDLKFYS